MRDEFGYLGNPNIKRAGVSHAYTKEEFEEYVKCSTDIIYFVEKYVKIITLDHGLQLFEPYEYQERMLEAFDQNRFCINLLPRQTGKALSLDTKLKTPDGYTTMGECNIGDELIGNDGKPTKIVYKSEIQETDTYEIEFDNGEIVKSASNHIWRVGHGYWKEKDLTLEEIIEFQNTRKVKTSSNLYVNISKPIEYEYKDLPIDPYYLGVWLGDGDSSGSRIHGAHDDLTEIMSYIPYEKNKLCENKGCWVQSVKLPFNSLSKINVRYNKHIPNDYLTSSIDQRLELLRGLMDTNGSVSKTGDCEFYQKDSVLLDNVRELLSSLGIKSTLTFKLNKEYNQYYGCIRFTTTDFDVFKLKRKLDRQYKSKNHPKNKRLYIKSITKIETEKTQCIQVDNDSHMYLCGETMIPTHNTTVVAAYLLHYSIFTPEKSIGILANKEATAVEILSRIKRMLENLPLFLQPGVKEYNKKNVKFANDSELLSFATGSDSVRGRSFNVVYLDEFAFVENAEEFYTSTYPVISSGETTRVIITSTPNGMNLFYKLWMDAKMNRNDYFPLEVKWNEHPKRDEAWKKTTLRNIGKRRWSQEFGCRFIGSTDTLIEGDILSSLVWKESISEDESNYIYYDVEEDHNYVINVDVSEGAGLDYSVINVTDITTIPYKQVHVWRNNKTTPLVLPEIIERLAMHYNDAFVLIETNSIGSQVANILYYEYEYENMLTTKIDKQDNIISSGFGASFDLGIRMTKKSKHIGCSNIKSLIENNIYEINDFNTIEELQTFSRKGKSYEAEQGKFDDIVMTLVGFGWLTTEDYFVDLTSNNARKIILDKRMETIEEDLVPPGYYENPAELMNDDINRDYANGYSDDNFDPSLL